MLYDLERTGKVEAVRNAFVQCETDIHHIPHLAAAVPGDLLTLADGADGRHNGA